MRLASRFLNHEGPTATHLPVWQRHEPPQSIVPGTHIIVHMIPRHSGFLALGTHRLAWQQTAGTQSSSLTQPRRPPDAGAGADAIAEVDGAGGALAGGAVLSAGGADFAIVTAFSIGGCRQLAIATSTKRTNARRGSSATMTTSPP